MPRPEIVESGAQQGLKEKYENKPEEYFDLEKLRKSLKIDRKIGWRELYGLNLLLGNADKRERRPG
jgi:hypothetical protein